MARIEKTVFVSYRRPNAPWALAIFQHLTHNGYDVFFDFSGIASGDFERVILENIHARAHFLVLLTPSALERCSTADDWLRREIEAALEAKRNIVPLMLEGFDFNSPGISNQLTGQLEALRRYNAIRVPVEYFEEAMARLRNKYLNVSLDAVLHPVSRSTREVAEAQQKAASSAPAVQESELTAQHYFERAFEATSLEEKLRFYNQALMLKPDHAPALFNRASVRKSRGELLEALEDYDAAIRIKPDYSSAFNNRGILRHTQGDRTGARHDFDEAVRLRPNYAAAYNNRGILRMAEGDLTGAREDYDEAIRCGTHYATPFYNRSVVRTAQGDVAGASDDLAEAIRLRPDYAARYRRRGLSSGVEDHLGSDPNEGVHWTSTPE